MMDIIRKELLELEDPAYRDFHAPLLPGIDNIIGVRIPQLRTLAKVIAKEEDWRTFVEATDTLYYEETMLQGMVIGIAKTNLDEQLKYVRLFVPRINNWAVCDVFCGELKTAVRKDRDAVFSFISSYLTSAKEFEVRFGIVMLFQYIDSEHIDLILNYADIFRYEEYYARMAMAWLLSICFVKFPDETMSYLQQSKLDSWTYNKALQKTIESLRVDKATKEVLRAMKRKGLISPCLL